MRAFFTFVGALLVAGIAFGLYISGLEKCSVIAAGGSGITAIECHKLYLAFGVLFAIAILLLLAAAFYAFVPAPTGVSEAPGKLIFENFIKIFPPIITLVLGYYFGSTGNNSAKPEAKPVGQEQKQQSQAKAGENAASEPTKK
jgi:hypothetical protein